MLHLKTLHICRVFKKYWVQDHSTKIPLMVWFEPIPQWVLSFGTFQNLWIAFYSFLWNIKKAFLNRQGPIFFQSLSSKTLFSKWVKKRVKKIINLPQGPVRELRLGIIIASFINRGPEWLRKVTKQASVEAETGTDVSCLPVQAVTTPREWTNHHSY